MKSPLLACLVFIAATIASKADAQRVQRVDRAVEQIRSKYDLPALTAAVLTPEKIIAIGVAGVRAKGSQTPATIHDQWHIGSCTKAMTATLLARVVAKTPLTWETTLEEVYGPANVHPELRAITVKQLLGHRSGLSRDTNYRTDQSKPIRVQRTELVQRILSEPPEHPPGTQYHYSNAGYIVAGHIAETAADQSWEELMVAGIFEPLGMKQSGFGAPPTDSSWRQPIGHSKIGTHAAGRDNPPVLGPAGTVHCTLSDWARFVSEHMKGRNGESDLLPQETYEQLHAVLPGQTYALGWGTSRNASLLHHAGSNTMWYCTVFVDLKENFAVLVATNIANDNTEKAVRELQNWLIEQQRQSQKSPTP